MQGLSTTVRATPVANNVSPSARIPTWMALDKKKGGGRSTDERGVGSRWAGRAAPGYVFLQHHSKSRDILALTT